MFIEESSNCMLDRSEATQPSSAIFDAFILVLLNVTVVLNSD